MDATAATVVVGIGAAFIGAIAALGGVFFGSRWQAEAELAHWRRDKLLQYCSDLLASAREISRLSLHTLPGDPVEVPEEKWDQLYHLRWCILLLSEELSAPLEAYYVAAWRFVKEGRKASDATFLTELIRNFQKSERAFAFAARDLLLSVRQSPAPWWPFWSRNGSKSKPKTEVKAAPAPARSRRTPPATSEGEDTPGDSAGTC